MTLNKIIATVVATTTLCACANTGADYSPIIDGPTNITYSQDLADCRALAKQRSYTNGDVKSDALLGAGVGALAGGIDDGVDGAIGGLILGGLLGGGGRAWETQEERKAIVINCLSQRGHRVVG